MGCTSWSLLPLFARRAASKYNNAEHFSATRYRAFRTTPTMDLGTEMSMVEIPCQRTLDGAAFTAGGVQIFQFGTGQPRCWSPARSYLRYTVEVTGGGALAGADARLGGDSSPKLPECIALAENCIANAYTNGYFLGGGATVSQCVNFLSQASAIEGRTTNSLGWLKSIGAGYQWNGDFASRVAAISRSVSPLNVATPSFTPNANALPGFSQTEGKQTISRPIPTGSTLALTTVAINIAGLIAFGVVDTLTVAANLGATLVINGQSFVLSTTDGAALLALPAPVIPIVATSNWYLVARNIAASDQAINTVDVLWRPTALGFFSYDGWIGSGDWQLNLTPNVNYATAMLQTGGINSAGTGALAPANVNITNVRFYMCQMKMSIPNQITVLHLKEYQIQAKQLNSNNLVFTVPASTEMLYVFVQDGAAGTDTRLPPSLFGLYGNAQNNVTQLQLTYANLTKPQTVWLSGYRAPPATGILNGGQKSLNSLVQFYNQHQQELGRANDATGVETFNQWLERGALYAFNYVRDSNERGTEVQMSITLKTPGGIDIMAGTASYVGNPQVFVCAEYRRVVEMTQNDGAIVAVKSLNA